MNNAIAEFEESCIFFSIKTFNYAFSTKYVLDIMQLVELEYPESMPPCIAGLLEYNNKIIKIVDLRNVLNLETAPYNLNSKIIIVNGEHDIFGIIIDDVKEIRRIKKSSFNSPPYIADDSCLEAIFTDKEFSATIINIKNIEKKINSNGNKDNKTQSSASLLLPKDIESKEILHRRRLHYARKMRQVSYEIIKSKDTYITFLLDKNTCCIKILHIAGFYKLESLKLIKVPCTPDYLKGIVSIKGRYITVIDLLKYIEDKPSEITKETSIIVIEHEDYELGIIADAIGETIDIAENLVNFKSENMKNCLLECVIDSSMYLFLDVKKLFEDDKLYVS